MNTKRYVGVDIGKKKCKVAVMDQQGMIQDEFAFTNNHEGIEWFASKLSTEDKVVMESTGSVRLAYGRIYTTVLTPGRFQ